MTDLINQIRDFILVDRQLFQKLRRIDLLDGQLLFKQGDRDRALYLIQSGQIKLYTCNDDDSETVLSTLDAGGTLGEFALLDNCAYEFNAVSVGSSTIWCFDRDDFLERVQTSTELSFLLIQLLSKRIDCLLLYIANFRDQIHQIIAGEYSNAINSLDEIDRYGDRSFYSISLLGAATESLKKMIQTIEQIQQNQSQPVKKLKLEIDQYQHQKQLQEIVSSDYFDYLIELSEKRNTVYHTEKPGENNKQALSFNKSRNNQVNFENKEIKQALKKGLENRSKIFNYLILKAWEDDKFKQELLANPKAVYAREFSHEVPDNLVFEIVEESLDAIKILLPVNPFLKIQSEKLSEEILDAIAGGNWNVTNKNSLNSFDYE
ncbi:MAG: NHLP leader peptide family RiPP precursor [Waterburya sp.]